MSSLVIIGAQWGDEGKGKLVDFFTSNADWVVRFHGGNNAGHTLVVNGVKTKLSLLPSGILRAQTQCAIGAGVVLNPQVLYDEMAMMARAGIMVTPEKLVIDREAHIIMGYHVAIDQAREQRKGDKKIGTTGRGIGPAYEDRAARCGIRVAELADCETLREKLRENIAEKNAYLSHIVGSKESISFEAEWKTLQQAAEKLAPFVGNVSLLLDRAFKNSERVIFEGAQGTFLDTTFGTFPFVTSSSTLAGAVTTGCGIGPKRIEYVLGVAKAYSTRVGRGPFPTELADSTGDLIRERGAEFGTVTGRPRRCGWCDAVTLRRAVRLNGIDSLALTKLDVLSRVGTIKVCTGYQLDGKPLVDMPALVSELERVVPEYEQFEGWEEDLTVVREWNKLPAAARRYLDALGQLVGCPISLVSVGAEREATIFSDQGKYLKSFL